MQSVYVAVIEYLTIFSEGVTKVKCNPRHVGYVPVIVLLLLKNAFSVCNICGVM
jgi:hypothetical protein